MDSYTLADLERVTGAKRRSLQLWADAGVILAERGTNRAGTGKHRRFSRKQAIIACIIHGFASRQIAIGELSLIAVCVSVWLHQAEKRNPGLLRRAIRGEGDALLSIEAWRDDNGTWRDDNEETWRQRAPDFNIESDAGVLYVLNVFPTADALKFYHLHEPEGFAAVVSLRTYLSKMDE